MQVGFASSKWKIFTCVWCDMVHGRNTQSQDTAHKTRDDWHNTHTTHIHSAQFTQTNSSILRITLEAIVSAPDVAAGVLPCGVGAVRTCGASNTVRQSRKRTSHATGMHCTHTPSKHSHSTTHQRNQHCRTVLERRPCEVAHSEGRRCRADTRR